MKDAEEFANKILTDIAQHNPYNSNNKTEALCWGIGFLARVCAEMIWSDSRNWQIYRRVRDKIIAQKGGPAA